MKHMVSRPSHICTLSGSSPSEDVITVAADLTGEHSCAPACVHKTHLSLAGRPALSRVALRVRVQVQRSDGRRAADGVRRIRVPVQQRVRLGRALEGREDVLRGQRHRQRQQAACMRRV